MYIGRCSVYSLTFIRYKQEPYNVSLDWNDKDMQLPENCELENERF